MAAPAFNVPQQERLWQLVLAANEAGIRLEMVGGTPVWEAWPGIRHQKWSKRIDRSIKPSGAGSECECYSLVDVYVRFPDGSLKRLDVAIFGTEPEDVDGATERIPEAVIEILSKGYERKDLEIGIPFYLANGVREVLAFDPAKGTAEHHTLSGVRKVPSGSLVHLQCGCTCQV